MAKAAATTKATAAVGPGRTVAGWARRSRRRTSNAVPGLSGTTVSAVKPVPYVATPPVSPPIRSRRGSPASESGRAYGANWSIMEATSGASTTVTLASGGGRKAVRSTGGTAIAVTDEALLAAQVALAQDEGTWVCPECAACFAAVGQLRESGWLSATDEVVVLNTGTGLIYPDTVAVDVPVLARDATIGAEVLSSTEGA